MKQTPPSARRARPVGETKAPTRLVIGDADSVRTSHGIDFFELLDGGKRDGGCDESGIQESRLAILPGTTHNTIFSSSALCRGPAVFGGKMN